MTLLALATWSAVVVLVVGSVVVFVWFLFDIGEVLHGHGPGAGQGERPAHGWEPRAGPGQERPDGPAREG